MKFEKGEKLVTNLHDKTEYVIQICCSKQELNRGLVFKKVHRITKFNQIAWLKSYIDMKAELRKKTKDDFGNDFFKVVNNAVFGKTMQNLRKYRDIKLAIIESRRNYFVSEPNYHTSKFFTENILAIEMRKTQVVVNKPVYLGLSILDLCKTLMYEFSHDYVKPKFSGKAKLCSIDTDSIIVHVKADDIFKDIAEDIERRLGTSKYESERPLPKEENKK